VAAIAGGTVGGVVGVAILLGLGWWFRRRRRAARKTVEKPAGDEKSPKTDQVIDPSLTEADAGPDSVLVESDAGPTQVRSFHELAA
jgi:LPXTG-motif cell wall-anchored protein